MPHGWDEARGQESVVQDVAEEQVADDGDILLQHEVGGPLVHHFHLVVVVTVLQDDLFRAHGEVEPTLDGGHVIRSGMEGLHGVQAGACAEVQDSAVPVVLLNVAHRLLDRPAPPRLPVDVLQRPQVHFGHPCVGLHSHVVVSVLHVVVVLSLKGRQKLPREHVLGPDLEERSRVGLHRDLCLVELAGGRQGLEALGAAAQQVPENFALGKFEPSLHFGVEGVALEAAVEGLARLLPAAQARQRHALLRVGLDVNLHPRSRLFDGRTGKLDATRGVPESLLEETQVQVSLRAVAVRHVELPVG
mmetsp:Transcript_34930/g.75605  ORF Transcript_34930/g.75605 Transcript_34930/m.75605 type:complete len:303 (-) Transcript_34930:436-1344(-)